MQVEETTGASAAAGPLQPKGIAGYGLYAAMGVVVGLCSGLFGIGGGVIMVPFLVLVARFNQPQAQGISLATIVVTALAGASRYYREGNLTGTTLLVALALAIGSVPGAMAGASIAQKLPKEVLGTLFALLMVAMAVRIMPSAGTRTPHALPVGAAMLLLIGMMLVGVSVRVMLSR